MLISNCRDIKIVWLSVNIIMVFSMVAIGGITRLTDSGLSMTDWALFGGVIPPLNDSDWRHYFSLYKQTPEFLIKNFDMNISEFKMIFFWEYFHRIWGRLIGLTFLLPLGYLWYKGAFTFYEKRFLAILSILGLFQAFMGWFMVKSGLVDKPDVSHFRLSIHLLTAFLIYSMLVFLLWRIKTEPLHKNTQSQLTGNDKLNSWIVYSIISVLITVATGAFVSGTDSGLAYNSFPLMDNNLLPPILLENSNKNLLMLLNDSGFIQFFHRLFATLTLITILITFILNRKSEITVFSKKALNVLFFFVVFQYTLGITILLTYVPMLLGLVHQLSSLMILTILVLVLSEINVVKSRIAYINNPASNQ